ncbi:MAG: bifunctional indole-3-glycerol phosphate synthase/phosphoribosylanthranilate isomerase, partial [Treponemataceae bacterium]|nr:bifunctional indole-3-glycerol phosphate synthase/phosphoribosylanthranilate isomerase [Treponemataceae bacterium]
LLGEAAARNPADARALVTAFVDAPPTQNAAQWREFAEKPREKPSVKICGLTNLTDARKAAALGADFLGFIFWVDSPRRADEATVRHISSEIRAQARQSGTPAPKLVGVIVDADSDDGKTVRRLVREGVLDFIQLHGCTDAFFATPDTDLAHYAVVNVSDETDLAHIDALRLRGEPRI